jgi:hypothetical protein
MKQTITFSSHGLVTFVLAVVTALGQFLGFPKGVESDLVQVTSFVLGSWTLGKAYNLKK